MGWGEAGSRVSDTTPLRGPFTSLSQPSPPSLKSEQAGDQDQEIPPYGKKDRMGRVLCDLQQDCQNGPSRVHWNTQRQDYRVSSVISQVDVGYQALGIFLIPGEMVAGTLKQVH